MFDLEIFKVLKQVHPNTGINTVALNVIDDLLVWLMVKTLNAADKLPITPTPEDEYDQGYPPCIKLFQRLYFGTKDNTAHAEICPWMAFIEFPGVEELNKSAPGYKPESALSFPYATGNEPPAGWAPKSFDSRTIQSAVRQVHPGELAKHAVSEGTKAVTKFNSRGGDCRELEVAAGLQFVPGTIWYQMRRCI
jgi:hypothetical protein